MCSPRLSAGGKKKNEVVFQVNSKEDFEHILENDPRLILVDLYSEWCGPCVQMTPTLKTLIVNIDSFERRVCPISMERTVVPSLAEKYPESSKPRFLFYEHGKCVEVIERVDAPAILRAIDEYMPTEWDNS